MASGFFALFDDVATLLDDVATMSKVATKKTVGLLGDDLAVNAEKASGFASSRELPVIWAIAKGSFINKLIILPAVFLLTAFLPKAIVPLLITGAIYLAYEGAEKVYEYFFSHKNTKKKIRFDNKTEEQIETYEKKKIKSAIIVDFILSLEIIIITLSTVLEKPLITQIIVVSVIATLATIGVYGIVALIVRMDDLGYKIISLSKNKKSFMAKTGLLLVQTLPLVIRALSVIGLVAMLLVAGGIFTHNFHNLQVWFNPIPGIVKDFVIALIIGFMALFVVKSIKLTALKVNNYLK